MFTLLQSSHTFPSCNCQIIILQAGGLALLAPLPAACDLDIFHYTTAYIHDVRAIQALIVNRAV